MSVLSRRWLKDGGVVVWRREVPGYFALCGSWAEPIFEHFEFFRDAEEWLAKTRQQLALVRDLREAQRRSQVLLRKTHVKPA